MPAAAAPPARPVRLSPAQWCEQIALGAAIPAFYLALLSELPALVVLLYLAAAAASGWASWQRWRADVSPRRRGGLGFSAVLIVALLLSAAWPLGDGSASLVLRLGAALLCLVRAVEAIGPAFARGSLLHLLLLALTVFGLCGLGFWWLEPQAQSFGDGLWLAFTTAATVGYGDIVPTTPAAKIFAVFVVLLGLAVLSLVTAAIAAMWVQSEERRIEYEILRDLHQQLRLVRDELAALRREHEPASGSSPPPTPPAD